MLELHPVLAGIALCGLFAAVISTGPLNFLAPIQIIIRDVYAVFIRPAASDKELVLLNRVLAIVLLAMGWTVAVAFQEILRITYWAFAFRAGIAVILLSVTYIGARWVSESGAFWGLISGVVVFATWIRLGEPFGIHVALPSLAAVLITTLVVSQIFKRKHELDPEVAEALYGKK